MLILNKNDNYTKIVIIICLTSITWENIEVEKK